jgi:hypothetical protein
MQSNSHGNIGAATTRDHASTRSCNVRTPAAVNGSASKSVALDRLSQQSLHTAAETQKADNDHPVSSSVKPTLETNQILDKISNRIETR